MPHPLGHHSTHSMATRPDHQDASRRGRRHPRDHVTHRFLRTCPTTYQNYCTTGQRHCTALGCVRSHSILKPLYLSTKLVNSYYTAVLYYLVLARQSIHTRRVIIHYYSFLFFSLAIILAHLSSLIIHSTRPRPLCTCHSSL